MTPQARGNLVVNNKVNSPQQQIILPTSPLLNGNSLQNSMNGSNAVAAAVASVVNGVNACGSGGEQISSLYHVNGQQSFLGPFKVYSKYFVNNTELGVFVFFSLFFSLFCFALSHAIKRLVCIPA